MSGVLLAPSILSADFGRLAAEVQRAEEAGADWIHVDVMDGHFVPNLTIGPAVTEAVRRATGLPVDVHLMIEQPERWVGAFADAGADWITVHQETCPHLHRVTEKIRESGARPGVALNPSTPVHTLRDLAESIEMILVMSVNPGFGGQRFIERSLQKVREARELGPSLRVQVDGGVDATTAPAAVRAGADVLVAGSAIYGHPGGAAAGIQALRDSINEEKAGG